MQETPILNFPRKKLSQSEAIHAPTTSNELQVLFLKHVHLLITYAFQKRGRQHLTRTAEQGLPGSPNQVEKEIRTGCANIPPTLPSRSWHCSAPVPRLQGGAQSSNSCHPYHLH